MPKSITSEFRCHISSVDSKACASYITVCICIDSTRIQQRTEKRALNPSSWVLPNPNLLHPAKAWYSTSSKNMQHGSLCLIVGGVSGSDVSCPELIGERCQKPISLLPGCHFA